MKKIFLALVLLSQTLSANAFFAKPRMKLNHDLSEENLIMSLDSGRKVTVEFLNTTVCSKKKCRTYIEIDDNLQGTVKIIGEPIEKLDKGDKQANHTFEVKYNAKPTAGYVYLKDADTKETLHTIAVIIRSDEHCYQAKNPVKGKVTFPGGDAYIMEFANACELQRSGAVAQ